MQAISFPTERDYDYVRYYNLMIDRKFFFSDQPAKVYLRTYDSIQKIANGQDNDCATGSLYIMSTTIPIIRLSLFQKIS